MVREHEAGLRRQQHEVRRGRPGAELRRRPVPRRADVGARGGERGRLRDRGARLQEVGRGLERAVEGVHRPAPVEVHVGVAAEHRHAADGLLHAHVGQPEVVGADVAHEHVVARAAAEHGGVLGQEAGGGLGGGLAGGGAEAAREERRHAGARVGVDGGDVGGVEAGAVEAGLGALGQRGAGEAEQHGGQGGAGGEAAGTSKRH